MSYDQSWQYNYFINTIRKQRKIINIQPESTKITGQSYKTKE
jgi:hypothetical protein